MLWAWRWAGQGLLRWSPRTPPDGRGSGHPSTLPWPGPGAPGVAGASGQQGLCLTAAGLTSSRLSCQHGTFPKQFFPDGFPGHRGPEQPSSGSPLAPRDKVFPKLKEKASNSRLLKTWSSVFLNVKCAVFIPRQREQMASKHRRQTVRRAPSSQGPCASPWFWVPLAGPRSSQLPFPVGRKRGLSRWRGRSAFRPVPVFP